MKLTIVVDTDDTNGVKDSHKIVSHFYRKIAGNTQTHGREVKFGKIAFIKMLREFARIAKEAEIEGTDSAGLRFTKSFADAQFDLLDPPILS